jgi:hypothetical protein
MIANVLSVTIIHTGERGPDGAPYAVVIAETVSGLRKAARVDGDLSWLAINGLVEIYQGIDGACARATVSA